MPPVAKTRIPAAWHAIIVAATVVAPHVPPAIAAPRLRRETLSTVPRSAVARRLELVARQPDQEPALVQRDGRRDRAGRPDRRLGRGRDLDVLRDTAGRG